MISKTTVTLLTLAVCALTATIVRADTLADWTFENTGVATSTGTDFTYGPADSGSNAGGSSASGHHASSSTSWTFPAGNGSVRSFNSNNWAANDYYQFSLSTLNDSALTLGWDQTGSSTGPRDFKLAYSTDGSSFTDFGTYSLTAQTWASTGAPQTASHYSFDLSGVSALNNQSTVYFRLIDTSSTSITGGTVGTSGSDRVDNFTVSGTAAVPEPATLAIVALGAGLLFGAVRFHRRF